jgi:hypothetical protein
MMNFLKFITGFFMNFELLRFWPIMQIRKKGGWNLKKIFSSETTEPISTKLCWNAFFLICIIGQNRKSSKFIKNPVINFKKFIIMLIQFKFGHFWLKIEQFWPLKKFLFLVMVAILDTGRCWRTQIWKGTTQGSFQQSLVEVFYELWTFAYFDRLCKLEKRGDEI